MDARLLDVLHDAAEVELGAVVERVDVDLERVIEEAVDEDRRDPATLLGGGTERTLDVARELLLGVDDLHATTTEDVRGTHEHRVADVGGDLARLRERRRRAERGGRQAGLLEDPPEDRAVLSRVDRFGLRAEDRQARVREALREAQRRLATEGDDDALDRTRGELRLVDLEDVLEREGLEVEAVGGVVVRRDGLRVAVHHDRLVLLGERERRVHARVVELDALTDAVGARAEDDDGLALARCDLGLLVVRRVVVRGRRRELRGARVDRLEDGPHTERPAHLADRRLPCGAADTAQRGDLDVREAVTLGEREDVARERGRLRDLLGDLVDELDLVEEPPVDLRRLVDGLDARSRAQRLLDLDEPLLGRALDGLEQLVELSTRRGLAVPVERRAGLVDRAQRLAERLGEVAAEGHGLTDRLHGRRERVVGRRELLEREARDLDDDVVERRLERRGRRARDVVGDLVERVADRDLRRDLGDRVARRLRRERRGARHARVHLDDDDAARLRVDRELDVAAARVDADLADDRDADVTEVLVLAVRERERGRDRHRVARVDTDRVDVLDRADDDDVVRLVAHELELVLLPAEDRLLEEHLRRRRVVETLARDATQVGLVVRDARAEAAHGERRPHDERVTEVLGGREGLLDRVDDVRPR